MFCTLAALSVYQQGDHMMEVFEQEMTWISQGFLEVETEEEPLDDWQERLQERAAQDFLSESVREVSVPEKPDRSAAKDAKDVKLVGKSRARRKSRLVSRQPPTTNSRNERLKGKLENHRQPTEEDSFNQHEERSKEAEEESKGEGEPFDSQVRSSEKELDLPFNEEQIATVLKDLVYHMDNETIHRFWASQSTIGETHSGPSKKGAGNVHLSDAQKELVPEDGKPQTRYVSCALVGNARSLLKTSHGRNIDKHDAVMRLNQATTVGFEKYVGRKTTFRLINSKWASAYTTSNKLQLEKEVTLVVSRTDWRHFLRIARNLKNKRADVSSMLLSREAVNKAGEVLRELKRRMESVRGKPYPGKGSPSSGWGGTYFLLQMCDRVDIYGVGTTAFKEKVPNWHYFENHRFHSSREFGSDPHHSFMLEHEALLLFNKEKIIFHHP